MFKFNKRLFFSLLVVIGVGSFAEAVDLTSVPNAPGPYVGVTAVSGSQTSVRVNFLDNSNNEDGFRIFDDEGINVEVPANDETENPQVSKILTGLICNKVYQIKAVAHKAGVDSDTSDTRGFNIHTTFGIPCTDTVNAPGPDIGVTAVSGSQTSVRVNFLDNSNNEDGFRIFDDEGINVEIPANDETENPQVYKTLTGLVCNKVYKIKAVAHKAGVDSDTSDTRGFNIHTTFGIPCDGTPELQMPVADAGDDKQVEVDTVINIVGTGTDTDGVIVSYKWEENGVELATNASFDYSSSDEGNHTLVLTVTDDDGLMSTDTMIVTVNSAGIIPPVAVAGEDQVLTEGETVELNGSASFDPNGSVVSYAWSEGGSVFANSSSYALENLSVGEHTIELKVTDNDGLTDTDTLIVNIRPGTNQGVSFHTAFMTNHTNTGSISFFISALEDTTGAVRLSDDNETIDFTVTAGDIVEVEVPSRMLLSGTGTVRKVVKITSEKDIVVVGLNQLQYTTDAFLVLPDKLLGTEYYTAGYENIFSDEFALVATEDNTIINVNLANGLGSLDINLSEGEVYQYQEGAELTGSHIISNKNIAVVSGNQCTDIPDGRTACDHIVEQMLPVDTWEKEFISVPLKTRTGGDTFRIVASEDNSVITINGANVATLDAGEFFETVLTTSSHIISTNPIMVVQYSNSTSFDGVTSDPFMALVPALNQFDTTHVINTPSGFTDYINIVVPTANINDVALDGVNIDTAEFTVVAGTTYSSAQIQIAQGKHTVTSSAKIGILGYGFADYDSYGYPSSLRVIKHAIEE